MRTYLVVLLFVLPGPILLAAPPRGLENYEGKDLTKLAKNQRDNFFEQVEAVTGDKALTGNQGKGEQGRNFEPWWVRRLANGKVAWMLVEVYPGSDNPDTSGVRVHLFDKSWRRLSQQIFPTGYCMYLEKATVVEARENPLARDLLVVEVASTGPFLVLGKNRRPAFREADPYREYYSVLGGS
jgi:hypothetical protein